MKTFNQMLMVGFLTIALTACGSSGGGGSSSSTPTVVSLAVSATEPKALNFSWDDVGADYYRLLVNPDGVSGYSQVGSDIAGTSILHIIPVHLHDWFNASYIVQACNAAGCTDSAAISVLTVMLDAIGYFKASNTESSDGFGYSVSLSGDGDTMAVGAIGEASGATGINGDQVDNSAIAAGAVYVFSRSSGNWVQQAYIKASNAAEFDEFGRAVSLSGDGNTLAVGALSEDGSATGIDGNQADDFAIDAGAVYVFSRSGMDWTQQAYVKASNTDEGDSFGIAVSLSSDGNTLAVGALYEDSSATGVNGDQVNNLATSSGAVYVFSRSGTDWTQQAYVKASNTATGDYFGTAVSLSGDGNTLAVGTGSEDSSATGINGDQTDNSAISAGAVYVFSRSGTDWTQQAYIKASNTDEGDRFGEAVSLSGDGNTLAVGADAEDSSATGINGSQADNSASNAGAMYVFSRSNTDWIQQAYVKASNTDVSDEFGFSVSLSNDGGTLAVGTLYEDSSATGIDGDQTDNSASNAGAVYVFSRSGTDWIQQAYVKASNTEEGDYFSNDTVSLSGDGNTLAVGTGAEDSSATGINGDQADNSASYSGAVYLY